LVADKFYVLFIIKNIANISYISW